MSLMRFVGGLCVGLTTLWTGALHAQQGYPNKVIRVFTAAAGGGTDFIAREVAQGISGPLGQQLIIENRGTGVLAADAASKAPPDGYTLTVQGGAFWISPLLRKTPFDPIADFSPISLIVREVLVVTTHPSLPTKSVKDLIGLAKAKPGELNYASSSGVGSTSHLATEFFNSLGGINIVHIPYKGNAAALTALISGEVQVLIIDAGLIAPHIKSGRAKALAVTSAEPSALVPGLPTVAASGLSGYEWIGMTGMFVVGKPPVAIVDRLNQEVVRLLGRPDIKERFLKAGLEIVGSSPEKFAEAVRADRNRVSRVIKETGMRVE